MSKPITNAPTTPLTFEQRLQLVQAEIKSRTARTAPQQRNAARARLWVNWINRNVLEVV